MFSLIQIKNKLSEVFNGIELLELDLLSNKRTTNEHFQSHLSSLVQSDKDYMQLKSVFEKVLEHIDHLAPLCHTPPLVP